MLKRSLRLLKPALILCVCHLILLTAASPAVLEAAAGPATILITPLWFHSREDLTFLNRGVLEMLSTRLPREGSIVVLQAAKAPQDDQDALKTALKLEADYVLTGGVTLFDNNVSTDLRLLQTPTGRIIMQFSRFGRKPGDVLRHIDELAAEIVGLLTQAEQPPAVGPEPRRPEAPTPKPVAPRPEPQPGPPDPSGWRSNPLDLAVIGLALADIDGQEGAELVIAGEHQIRVCALDRQALTPMAQWKGRDFERIVAVDAADLKRDDPAEIYVTCLDKHQRLKSFVLAWHGGRLDVVLKDLPWFMRVLTAPGLAARLIGQKQRLLGKDSPYETDQATPFLPGIHSLTWGDGRLQAGTQLDFPRQTNLYGICRGKLLDPAEETLIALDGRDRLQLFSADGRRQWRSSTAFGGSQSFLKIPTNLAKDRSGRFYLPQRLLLIDPDNDGRHELLASRNSDSSGRLLARYRRYTQGRVMLLAWSGTTLKTVWQTDTLEGYISDIAVAPASNAKPGRLIMAVVDKDIRLLDGKQTWIVVEELDKNRFKF